MGQINDSASIYGASAAGIGGLKEDFKTLTQNGSRKSPFFDLLKEGPRAEANQVSVDVETIAAPSSLKVATGASFAFGTQNETSSIYNYVQESQKTWELGVKSDNARYAGRESERKRRQTVAVQELKRGIEYDILNSSARAAGNNTSPTAAAAGGLPYWITTNVDTTPVITQDTIMDLLGTIADYSGDSAQDYLLVGDSTAITAMSKMALATDTTVRVNKDGQTLDTKVSALITQFGSVYPLLVGTGTAGTCYLVNKDSMEIRFMSQMDHNNKERGMVHIWKDNPKMTAETNAFRGVFSSLWTLIVRDEKLNAKIVVA
jgi:hypothetical protein